MPLKHLPLGWYEQNMKAISYTLYEYCILHTSAVMYTFQKFNTAVNDKVCPDLDLHRKSN